MAGYCVRRWLVCRKSLINQSFCKEEAGFDAGFFLSGVWCQVFGVLMELVRSTGLSALIATHNMELAARMDRVVRLDQGRVVA